MINMLLYAKYEWNHTYWKFAVRWSFWGGSSTLDLQWQDGKLFSCFMFCILCIFNPYMHNRTGLSWTLCVFICPTTMPVISSVAPPSWSGIQNTPVPCASHRGHLCRRNCRTPIARTWCSPTRQLKMGNNWFCKLPLLFKIRTQTDTRMKQHECAYVSVLEEYNGPWKTGRILHILHFMYIVLILHIMIGFPLQPG